MTRIVVIDTRLWFYNLHHRKRPLSEFIPYIAGVLEGITFSKLIFAFDPVGGCTWRKNIFPEYKGHRKKQDAKKTLAEQNRIKAFNKVYYNLPGYLRIFGNVVNIQGYEADDIANIIANRYANDSNVEVLLVSKDEDWTANIIAPNIKVLKNEAGMVVSHENFKTLTGFVDANQYMDYHRYVGSPKENIQGVIKLGKSRYLKAYETGDVRGTVESWLKSGKFGISLPDFVNSLDELLELNSKLFKLVTINDLSHEEQDLFKKQLNTRVIIEADDIESELMLIEQDLFNNLSGIDSYLLRLFKVVNKAK